MTTKIKLKKNMKQRKMFIEKYCIEGRMKPKKDIFRFTDNACNSNDFIKES